MSLVVKKPLRVLVLCHEDLVPPASIEGLSAKEIQPWKTEYDVIQALRSLGHEVFPIGLYSDLNVIRQAIETHQPHIAFNLLEEFHGDALFDQHVVSYLELRQLPYTGCNPRGLTLAHDKALSKKILAYHRIPVPQFIVVPVNRKPHRPKRLKFPLFVKSLVDEGSVGISQASIVHDDVKLAERVTFIHEKTKNPAIVEEFIDGRELYIAMMGNERLQSFTPWELLIERLPEGAPVIATSKLKWDYRYQEKVGVKTAAAELTPELRKKVEHLSKRIYRLLYLSGCARLDFRMTPAGEFYLLEANPNPNISHGEDFTEAAEHCGLKYSEVLQKLLTLGLSYRRMA
ncbi:MAG: ddlA [Verrucomicrobia bacterium]|jgi:D-alanine-D-alanine ligase|nr:ddlA [Verrucomicrobiota bacterium]